MKILLLAASLRADSCNKKLINLIAKLSAKQKITTESLEFADFLAPLYNGDVEANSGIPKVAEDFITKLKESTGLIISSPEYNFSTPGTLKNLIDWVSRAKPMPWVKYPIMLCSASPSKVGGNRGLLSTATILQSCCNAHIFPPMFSLADAYEAFAKDGLLKDKNLQERLIKNVIEFVGFAKLIKER